MVTPSAKVAPILQSIIVARTPADAFRIFTEKIGTWWPAAGHSIGEERVADVVIEPAVGGRVYEVWDDGTQHDWARLLRWDPPEGFVMEWKPNPDRPAPTEVEIRFLPQGDGTRVEVEHREWDRLGEQAAELRESYNSGWPVTLQRFAQVAS